MDNTQQTYDDFRKVDKETTHCKDQSTNSIRLIANDIQNPINVGSLFRLADALGIEHLYLSGSTPTPPSRKITKTSRSAEKYVSYSINNNALELITKLKQENYLIISLEITSNSIDIQTLDLKHWTKVCLIIGSENEGTAQVLLDASDQTVHIPMLGEKSSMNLSNACAIAVYELSSRLAHD